LDDDRPFDNSGGLLATASCSRRRPIHDGVLLATAAYSRRRPAPDARYPELPRTLLNIIMTIIKTGALTIHLSHWGNL